MKYRYLLLAVMAGCGWFTPRSVHAVDVVVAGEVISIESTLPDSEDLWVTPADFRRINGFELKPEGACREEICIPLKQDADNQLFVTRDGRPWLNASGFADKLQQAFVVDREADVWSFGLVPSARKPFLTSAIAPDFELTDRNGKPVKLSALRGNKVLIITWASW